jgi:antitoxin component YwqK of YwqJK toxin-antitoxin module
MWDKHGDKIVERQFTNGKKNGMETAWENGNKLYIHHYKNDEFDGVWIYWGKNGQESCIENWKDGKLHGVRTTYYESGNKRDEENYKQGKLDGKKTIWYENGQKEIEAYFKGGSRYGVWTTWREDGTNEGETNWTKRYEKGERVPEGPVDTPAEDQNNDIGHK